MTDDDNSLASLPRRPLQTLLRSLGVLRKSLAVLLLSLGLGQVGCSAGDPERCFDVCGPGTQCVASKCILAEQDGAEVTTGAAEADSKKPPGKRRKKGKSGGDAETAGEDASETASELPPRVDDSKVASFDANATRTIDLEAGSEKLSDSVIRTHIGKLSGAFNKCIADAALRSEGELGSGEVEFDFGVGGNGRVTGVRAVGPKKLAEAGGIACLRVALHNHRFPIFDGPVMAVHSSLPYD